MTQFAIGALEPNKLLEKLANDMYFGDGDNNPSITVRLDRLERLVKGLGKLFWAVVATLIATVCDIVVHAHK